MKNPELLIVNAAIIQGGELLLLRKRNLFYWSFAGGKVDVNLGETNDKALAREVCEEELPGTKIISFKQFGVFSGITPNSKKSFRATVYLTNVESPFLPGAEIEEVQFFKQPEEIRYLSCTCRKIIQELRNNGLL